MRTIAIIGILLAGCGSAEVPESVASTSVDSGMSVDAEIDVVIDIRVEGSEVSTLDAAINDGSVDTMTVDVWIPYESNTALCARLGKDCGPWTSIDTRGNTRSIFCGSCPAPWFCGLIEPGVCGCIPDTDAAFCVRHNSFCGSVDGFDNCLIPRMVPDCGFGLICTAPATCSAGICQCIPETNTEFCLRFGRDCGNFTNIDNCGISRTAMCGVCTRQQICGNGVPNVCI